MRSPRLKFFLHFLAAAGVMVAFAVLFHFKHPSFNTFLKNVAIESFYFILFGVLVWNGYWLGRTVTRALTVTGTYWEVSVAVGLLIFGFGAFLLCAIKLFYPWVVRAICLAVVASSLPFAIGRLRALGRWNVRELVPGEISVVLLSFAILPFLMMCWVRAAPPPSYWDALVYHLYLPKLFLTRHGFVYLPRMVYASMPLGGQMMFAWAYAWGGLGSAAAVTPLFCTLALVATWRLAKFFMPSFWAVLAAAVLLLTPAFATFFPAASVDFILAGFSLMALNTYFTTWRKTGGVVLTGVLIGGALGVKYTAVNALLGFAAVFVFDLISRRAKVKELVLCLGVAFSLFIPWAVKAYCERGNPFFPSLYSVFGGRDLPRDVVAAMLEWQRDIGMGRSLVDYLLLPYRVSVEAGPGYQRFDGIMLPFVIPLAVLAVVWFRRWRLILFTAVYFAGWAVLASQQLRFLSAAFGTLAVLAAGTLAAGGEAFGEVGRRVSRGVFAFLIVAAGYVLNWGLLGDAAFALKYVITRDKDGYLSTYVGVYPVNKFINKNLPADARILMIFENHLLYLEREAVYDSCYEASETLLAVQRLNTEAEVARYVEGLGVSHILTSRWQFEYFWHYYDPATRALWERYLARYTVPIYDDGSYELREIIYGR